MRIAKSIDQRGEDSGFEPGCFVLSADFLQEADSPDGPGDFTQGRAVSGCVEFEQWKKQSSAG